MYSSKLKNPTPNIHASIFSLWCHCTVVTLELDPWLRQDSLVKQWSAAQRDTLTAHAALSRYYLDIYKYFPLPLTFFSSRPYEVTLSTDVSSLPSVILRTSVPSPRLGTASHIKVTWNMMWAHNTSLTRGGDTRRARRSAARLRSTARGNSSYAPPRRGHGAVLSPSQPFQSIHVMHSEIKL